MTLQVIKAEDVRDGEPRWWCDDGYAAQALTWIDAMHLHTEPRSGTTAACHIAIVDRPAPTPTTPPALDLDAVEAAERAMTPRKWLWSSERKCVDATQLGSDGHVYDRYSFGPIGTDELWDDDDASTWAKDAAGIVALRNAAPALIAEVRALRADVARRRATADKMLTSIARLDESNAAEIAALRAKLAEAKRLGRGALNLAANVGTKRPNVIAIAESADRLAAALEAL